MRHSIMPEHTSISEQEERGTKHCKWADGDTHLLADAIV
jgi:hypothetical protein